MIATDYTKQHFILFALFKDKSKLLGIPTIVSRWLVLLVGLLLTAILGFQELFIPAVVTVIITAVIVSILLFSGFLNFQYQAVERRRLYEEFDGYVGMPSLSYDEPKMNRRLLQDRLKTEWAGRALVSVTVIGEGGKISRNTADKFLRWIASAYKQTAGYTYILENTEDIQRGVLYAIRVRENSEEALLAKAKTKVFNVISAATNFTMDDWPKIELIDYDSSANPAFSEIIFSEFHDKNFIDRSDRVVELMMKAFALRKDKTWRLAQVHSDEISLSVDDVKGAELYSGKYETLLTNMISFLKDKVDDQYLSLNFKIKDINFEGSSETLLSFSIYFREFGRLGEDKTANRFATLLSKMLNKKLSGEWAAKNELFENNRILFKRRN